MSAPVKMTEDEWRALGRRLYGDDTMRWRFVCPVCGHIATPADWKAAGAPENAVAFSCVGRWSGAKHEAFAKGDGPCNYAGGGLFKLNPWSVGEHSVFAFADQGGPKP